LRGNGAEQWCGSSAGAQLKEELKSIPVVISRRLEGESPVSFVLFSVGFTRKTLNEKEWNASREEYERVSNNIGDLHELVWGSQHEFFSTRCP